MTDTEKKSRKINGTQKLQGWVAKEDSERVDFLIKEGYVVNPSDAVREGVRALWREYLAGNLQKIKLDLEEAPAEVPIES